MAQAEFTTEELISEEWREIPGYESLYEVSDLGRVRSLRNPTQRHRNVILRPSIDRCGYLRVTLHSNGKRHYWRVSRLVALAFLGIPGNLSDYEVDHKDQNHVNNCVGNLQWLTKKAHHIRTSEQKQHLRAGNHPNALLTNEEVARIKWMMGEPHSIREMADQMGCSISLLEGIKYNQTYTEIPWLRPPVKASRRDQEKIRLKMKELWQDSKYRQRMIVAHSGKAVPPEQRKKTSEALKRRHKSEQ